MPEYQIRCVLPYTSGLPGDEVVNTFSVIAGATADILTPFVDFYSSVQVATGDALGETISSVVSRSSDACGVIAAEINVATGEVSPPIAGVGFTMPAAATESDLPLECAVCTSFSAGSAPGVVAARRRGRVFIGPLSVGALNNAQALPRVDAGFIDTLVAATRRLTLELIDEGAELSVWSRADQALYPVTYGWVDNGFDTMRSREVDATARSTWTL